MKRVAFESLAGATVLVTRPRESDTALSRLLRRAGAKVVWQPTIHIADVEATPELDQALRRLEDIDWVVWTSVHGVSTCWRRMAALGIDPAAIRARRVAAVGPATARALERHGMDVTITASPHSAQGLLDAMAPWPLHGATVVYPRAAEVSPTLVAGLRQRGARVVEAPAYRTMPVDAREELGRTLEAGVECVVLCSPSATRSLLPHRSRLDGCAIACIGPTTARAAREAGLVVSIVPMAATSDALADAVIAYFSEATR